MPSTWQSGWSRSVPCGQPGLPRSGHCLRASFPAWGRSPFGPALSRGLESLR
jgi:hypothetical protein